MTIARSFGPVAEQMKEALDTYSKEELIDLMTHIVKTYVVEGTLPLKQEGAPRGREDRLSELTFPQLILHLQMRLDHRELKTFSVSGEDVWVSSQGQRINLTSGNAGPAPTPSPDPTPASPTPTPPPIVASAEPAPAPSAPEPPPPSAQAEPEPFGDDVAASERFGMLEID